MVSIRLAVLYSSATRYSMRFLGLLSTMVIARLLTPEEIGTFAIASAIVMVMSEFRLLGAGAYLVREEELTDNKIQSALGLTVLISWGLGGFIWIASPFVADFYNVPPIKTIFRILSISFFLAPFVSIPSALLTRSFSFKQLFIVKLATTLSNIGVTVGLILLGYSYFGLAWGYTLSIIVELLVVNYYRPGPMLWIPAFSKLGEIAGFGVYTSLASFFKRGVVTAPDMIIGKIGTTAQVGLFSRGLGFIEFVSQTILRGVNPVVLPYLAEVKRTGGDVNDAYTRASVLLGGILWPILSVASVVSLPAILLFFGDQWLTAAPYATLLAYWAIFRTVHWFSTPLLIARGFEKVLVAKEGAIFIAHFAAVALAFPFGLTAVAVGFVLAGAFDCALTTWLLAKYIGLNASGFLRSWWKNAAIATICGASSYVIYQTALTLNWHELWGLSLVAVVLPFVWLGLVFGLKHPLRPEVKSILNATVGR
ncbi:lipopolysaccharide biosynthesis protein [Marinobacter adhaerens]|uniref:Lipopolysaccharide biosynthesis protein n=1 Tax=Marinobacter adhaerens TaxID=1033846 RepID=A0A851HWL7_9GAMM|nr:lipopolysaccharide biosynthesis protein [Marinobacter adhaerens]NWN90418.1 lipopolysaccharide biosynthesis protein [Marinobacter adhaerens]